MHTNANISLAFVCIHNGNSLSILANHICNRNTIKIFPSNICIDAERSRLCFFDLIAYISISFPHSQEFALPISYEFLSQQTPVLVHQISEFKTSAFISSFPPTPNPKKSFPSPPSSHLLDYSVPSPNWSSHSTVRYHQSSSSQKTKIFRTSLPDYIRKIHPINSQDRSRRANTGTPD